MTDVPEKKKSTEDKLSERHDAPTTNLPGPGPSEHDETSVRGEDAGKSAIPDQIGFYKLLEPIGEGGMGAVYLAEQREPVKRKVALKIIKAGMDSKEVIARFETERQALAMMNHPNIARVLDAGTSEQGRPYFVMEHVPGVPITKYCDTQKLTTKERLHLFIQVCDAVQHSHQKGVIHRDIKPSNILVTAHEGDKPAVKVIDFGVAKATQHKLTEKTLFTGQGQMIGTPEYMSPEQTDMVGLDVDTRTDIYSLGVLLYELLVGTLPFSLREVAFLEVVQKIRKEEPQKPSTKITMTGGKATEIADARRTEPRSLAKEIRGDLDWITLTAMEKDRTRRYSAATELAEDIRRHLDNEPIQARPPTLGYQLKKLLWRNMGLVVGVLGSVVIAILVVAVLFVTVLYIRADGSRRDAEQQRNEVNTLKVQLEDSLRTETRLRKEAESARGIAQEKHQAALAAKEREEKLRAAAEEARIAAAAHREEAERQRDEILRLADARRLDQLRASARTLWPANPEKLPELNRWLSEASALASKLTDHSTALEQLRQQSGFYVKDGDNEDRKGGQSDWTFEDNEIQWHHDLLTELVRGLTLLVHRNRNIGLMANVRKRRSVARRVLQETTNKHDEWNEAIVSIADPNECPQYEGLKIRPQPGLVPIGQDPDSGLWEFAHIQTGAIAGRDDSGRIALDQSDGLVFVLIPGGAFEMGSQASDRSLANYDPNSSGEEQPVHTLRLDPFFLSKYEMTVAQWNRFAQQNPDFRDGRRVPDLTPVDRVTFEEFDRMLFRLGLEFPTEAQWEYAARARTTTPWWCGTRKKSIHQLRAGKLLRLDHITDAGVDAGHSFEGSPSRERYSSAEPVGSYVSNGFGLHDVIGNVWEWCREGDIVPYDWEQGRDGDGYRADFGSGRRVIRGGSFLSTSAYFARSACRAEEQVDSRRTGVGLRPARTISP